MNNKYTDVANNFNKFIRKEALNYGRSVISQLKKMNINTNFLLDSKYNPEKCFRQLFNKFLLRIIDHLNVILDNNLIRYDNNDRRITKNQLVGQISEDLFVINSLKDRIGFDVNEYCALENLNVDCIYDLKSTSQEKGLRSDIYELYKAIKC